MNIQEIAVNTNDLQRDINAMKNALDQVKKRTDSMFQEVNALNGMWEGPAHEAFARQFAADYQIMQELQKEVEKLIECMQYADKEYLSCESSITTIINSIRI